jgi:hypothetical protein
LSGESGKGLDTAPSVLSRESFLGLLGGFTEIQDPLQTHTERFKSTILSLDGTTTVVRRFSFLL